MSIINKMLQDLDRRQGLSEPDATVAMPQVRTVRAARGDREWFWRIVAVLLVASVGWVAWIAWQLQPRESIATDLALKAAQSAPRGPPAAKAPAAAAQQSAGVVQPQAPVAQPPAPAAQPQAPVAKVPPPAAQALPPVAQAPPLPVPAKPPPAGQKPAAPVVVVAGKPAVKAVEAPKVSQAIKTPAEPPKSLNLDVPPARILQAPTQAQGPAQVEKRDRFRSGQERAEAEFRRGVGLLNQGRASEAEEAFAAALATLPEHEAARQALVAMNLEQRRIDEARRLLQEGVALHPDNARFASVLARILIERKDYTGALRVLNGLKAPAQGDAEFQAMRGTALQRLARHAEAATAFQSSVSGAPQNGAAWIGLGVSLEALGRRPEAAEAFQRAAAIGTLSTEARDYAEQRARQLQ